MSAYLILARAVSLFVETSVMSFSLQGGLKLVKIFLPCCC